MRLTNKLQISISTTNPLNLYHTLTMELKDVSPPLLVIFTASIKNWFFSKENERGMFCVGKIDEQLS